MSAERTAGTLPGPNQLLAEQTSALEAFFGKEAFPQPPKELMEFLERTHDLGFSFEPYLKRDIVLTQYSEFPGWKIKPNPWFWEQINAGRVSPDAVRLKIGWGAMETIARPNYDGGKQLHQNDPLAPILEDLRKAGAITVPDYVRHVPLTSRFAVPALEVEGLVIARFVEIAGDRAKGVKTPPVVDYNYVGNLAHPEFGKADTWEWFSNPFGRAYRLIGGHFRGGGLACVTYCTDNRRDNVAFRLQKDFPSNPQ